MRETLWFVASLAGAAILTALAVIVSPQSPLWRDVLVGGAYILLVCAVLIFFDMRQPLRERPKMIPLIGMVICGIGFILFAGIYFWPSKDATAQVDSAPALPQEKASADLRISISCSQEILPKTLSADDSIQVLRLFPLPIANGGGGLGTEFNRSGQSWKWPIADPGEAIFISAYRCEIANYGPDPVVDLEMAIDLT